MYTLFVTTLLCINKYVIANSTERVQWFLLTTGLKIALTRDT